MNDQFNKIVNELNLGSIIEESSRVSGGLTHRMFKVVTTNGKYIIKLLNPSIMKRPTALPNFNRADSYEEILKNNDISAIYSLKINDKKLQCIDGQYLYVYEWYDGRTLIDDEITKSHCEKIGSVLAKIHNIDLKEENYIGTEKHIDWNFYIEKCREENIELYNLLYDKIGLLNESMNKGNDAIKNIPNVVALCHNDMDSKNVMWIDDEYKLIDLECLDYSNPYLELFELALCWSGYEKSNIDFDLFKAFINSYIENTDLNMNINWENIYYSNNGRLEWLEYNLKRALLIECSSDEEQKIGIKEVKETIDHIVYYDKVKQSILKNMQF